MIRQERELAEKRAAEDRGRAAAFAGQELFAHLQTAMLRAVAGGVSPADREIALIGSLAAGTLSFPWQAVETSVSIPRELADAQEVLVYTDPAHVIERLREASKQAPSINSRAKATLLLAIALRRAGKKAEAGAAEKDLRLLPVNVTDEYGVPYFLYAAKRIAGSPEAEPALLRDLDATLSSTWLPPAGAFMIADIAHQAGPQGATLEQRALARAKELERATALLSEISAGPSVTWRISMDSKEPLMASIAETKMTFVVIRARPVLNSIKLPMDAEWAMGSGNGGLPVHDSMPQLKLHFASAPATGKSFPRQLLYSCALGLVLITTALSAFLLHRDIQRETGLARLRSAFVSSVSHELRTPIATIRAYAEMLDMGRIQAAQWPGYLKTIIAESERLSRLVEGILEFARLEQGKRTYRFEPSSLNDVIQSAVQAMRCTLDQNGFELRINSDADLSISADHHALEQVFINLLSNAVKYSGECREIDLGVRSDGQNAIIKIRDYGVGIAPEDQRRIFERFYRAEAPDGRRVPGVGLGLSIVQQIVTAHGGRVALESGPGEGSVFSIILPLHA
jgi:signal transduction histidine kinase